MWSTSHKIKAMRALSDAKDRLDESYLSQIIPEMAEIADRVFNVSGCIVTAPSARHSAFIGVAHFASHIAKGVAETHGMEYRQCFHPIAAKWKGHSPKREKEPPVLITGSLDGVERVILVDDVATSRETLELHAKAIQSAGCKVACIVWIQGETAGTGRITSQGLP